MTLQQHIGKAVSDVLAQDINAVRGSGVSYRKRLLALFLASGGRQVVLVTREVDKSNTLSMLSNESLWYRERYLNGWTVTFPTLGGSVTVESIEHHNGLDTSWIIIDDQN